MDGTAAKNRKQKQLRDRKLNQNCNGIANDDQASSADNIGGEGDATNLTWIDIAAAINNTMLAVCFCITLLSIFAIIISFLLKMY